MTLFCKDCEFYEKDTTIDRDYCKHPETSIVDVVRGDILYITCKDSRDNFCRPNAKLYVPIKSS